MSEKQKQYYDNFLKTHKDKINEKIMCEICGGTYSYFNKSTHLKTKKHINVAEIRSRSKD